MAITVTKKVDLKLKKIHFEEGVLVDENGEVIDLVEDLKSVYQDKEFDLSAAFTTKDEHEVSDFK